MLVYKGTGASASNHSGMAGSEPPGSTPAWDGSPHHTVPFCSTTCGHTLRLGTDPLSPGHLRLLKGKAPKRHL